MPTVLRVHGFRVSIFFPPREHPPAHVHVRHAEAVVVIQLADGDRPQSVLKNLGMRPHDVWRAERLVSEHTDLLQQEWRRIWGE